MDRIIMKNLAFYGYHGAMEEEKTLGQKFFIDVEIYTDLNKAGKSDDVIDTVHYGEVYEVIKSRVEDWRFMLIEALAENIADSILEKFIKVQKINITVKKPEAPVPGVFDHVAVQIERSRI